MGTQAEIEQAAIAIATALKPQVDSAIAIIATAKSNMEALIAASPNVGSSRAMMIQFAEVSRNYAHAIARPLTELGVQVDLSAFD